MRVLMAGGNDLRGGTTALYLSVQGRDVPMVNVLDRGSRGEELTTELLLRVSRPMPVGETTSPV